MTCDWPGLGLLLSTIASPTFKILPKALKQRGAKDVYVYITHGVLSGDAVKAIKNSPIKKLVIKDTINNENKVRSAKNIEILSISNLMGEAIRRISNSTSVSFLFK